MNFDPAVISSITALVAVVIGPLVSVYVTKKQINSSVVSKNRQDWINRLRDELANFLSEVQHVPSAYSADALNQNEAIASCGEIAKKIEFIKLLLNPNENDHQELVQLISLANEKVVKSVNRKKGNVKEIEKITTDIVRQSQLVLKQEWERVKAGN